MEKKGSAAAGAAALFVFPLKKAMGRSLTEQECCSYD